MVKVGGGEGDVGKGLGEGHLIMLIIIAKLMNWVLIPVHNSLYKIVANTRVPSLALQPNAKHLKF